MAFILSPPRAFHSIGDFPLPDASKFDTDESVFYEKDGEMLVVCKEDKGIEGATEVIAFLYHQSAADQEMFEKIIEDMP